MQHDPVPDKLRAIYRLRVAVERKVRAGQTLWEAPSASHRDALLKAIIDMDARTIDAISTCLDCEHDPERARPHLTHDRVRELRDNVVGVDFGSQAQRDGDD
jgi:hypothetical protein